jgi:hypothetical protein
MARHKKPADSPVDIQGSLQEMIRARAYQLYCESGYQEGHETEHWLEAERQVRSGEPSEQPVGV